MNDSVEKSAITNALAALHAQGAERFDPVRYCYFQAMLRRASQQREAVAKLINEKVVKGISEYIADFERVKKIASITVERVSALHPEHGDEIKQYLSKADFKSIEQLANRLAATKHAEIFAALVERIQKNKLGQVDAEKEFSFDDLLRKLESQVLHSYSSLSVGSAKSRREVGELKSFRTFRDALIKQNAEKIMQEAINSAPENAGPLNSEMLTIRSLIAMRDLSPEYTNRIICYIDTLLWLEKSNEEANAALPAKGKAKRKAKVKK